MQGNPAILSTTHLAGEPPPKAGTPLLRGPAADRAFRLYCLNRNSTTLGMLRPGFRNFQGFMITGQNSGTHWIKWMLSHAIAHRYQVPPPKYFNNESQNDFICHPRHPRIYPQVPRIASSHTVAPYALGWNWVRRLLPPPPYVVIVRDIRDVLISTYEKYRDYHDISFSDYVYGDPRCRTYACCVWSYMNLMNRWGSVAERYPRETLVLTYEGFKADKLDGMRRVAQHFNLDLSEADIEAGAAMGSKEVMANHRDPNVDYKVIRREGEGDTRFSEDDVKVLNGILDRHLKHDFGYNYFSTPRGFRPKG